MITSAEFFRRLRRGTDPFLHTYVLIPFRTFSRISCKVRVSIVCRCSQHIRYIVLLLMYIFFLCLIETRDSHFLLRQRRAKFAMWVTCKKSQRRIKMAKHEPILGRIKKWKEKKSIGDYEKSVDYFQVQALVRLWFKLELISNEIFFLVLVKFRFNSRLDLEPCLVPETAPSFSIWTWKRPGKVVIKIEIHLVFVMCKFSSNVREWPSNHHPRRYWSLWTYNPFQNTKFQARKLFPHRTWYASEEFVVSVQHYRRGRVTLRNTPAVAGSEFGIEIR